MKIRMILISIIVLTIGELAAQDKPRHFSKEDVIARKWEFIQEKANLSPSDMAKVEPIFKETEQEVWNLIEKNRTAFKNSRKKDANAKIDYEAINEAIVNFEIENAVIQRTYYIKLKKLIAPDVINRLLTAEKAYKRELIQNAPNHKRGMNPPPK